MPTQYRCPCGNHPSLSAQQQPIRGPFRVRQPAPVSFSWKETGASDTAAALIALGFAATPLVTIGVTNADVTSNSAVDDGAADQGMDCT
ncbi:hypothetical protein C1883_04955 [Pseudomonas protegens]|nr:hypothetical protein C1883_04955 [Pseudomonas protegens]